MNINNCTNLSFNGGFRFRAIPKDALEKLPNITPKGKQIFYDFENKGDVFLTIKNEYDYKALKFIKEHNLNFEYFPNINTKSGLDNEKHEPLSELIRKTNISPITTKTQLTRLLAERKKLENINYHAPQYIDKILKTLYIEPQNISINLIKGAQVITENQSGRKIIISPRDKFDIYYVKVLHNDSAKSVERYAIAEDGMILSKYSSPEGIKSFQKRFNSLLLKTNVVKL